MKKCYLFLNTIFVFLSCVFSLQAQTAFERHIVVSGDTTVLNIDNYTSGNIQWQEKDRSKQFGERGLFGKNHHF